MKEITRQFILRCQYYPGAKEIRKQKHHRQNITKKLHTGEQRSISRGDKNDSQVSGLGNWSNEMTAPVFKRWFGNCCNEFNFRDSKFAMHLGHSRKDVKEAVVLNKNVLNLVCIKMSYFEVMAYLTRFHIVS